MAVLVRKGSVFRAAVGGLLATVVSAETITLKQGAPLISEELGIRLSSYDGTQDAYVRSGNAFAGGASNFGGAPTLGINQSSRISLLRFDLSCLRDRFDEIHSVTLRLWTQQADAAGTLDVYRLAPENSAWREGRNDGGTCLGCNQHIVTWMHLADFGGFPQPSPTWASGTPGPETAGIDYDEALLGIFDNEDAVADQPFEIDIDGDLLELITRWSTAAPVGGGQGHWTPDWNWRQPAPTTANEGFLLRGFEGGTHWVYSSEGPPEFRPELIIDLEPSAGATEIPCEHVELVRGDANDDGAVDVSDAVSILLLLFGDGQSTCDDAYDCDDDGFIAVTDPIVLLEHVFQGGPRPSPPYPGCGVDFREDELRCEEYSSCG